MELNSFYDLYTNDWITNIILMVGASLIAAFLAYLVPLMDQHICNKIGLNLQGGISTNAKADFYRQVRRVILLLVFGSYVFVLFYLVLFARKENPDYSIRNAGFSLFTMTMRGIELPEMEAIEFYLNVVLFIPMGYLLPYSSKFFRNHAVRRPLIACFLTSVLIENLQLMTKRGTYDTADVISNTLGGAIGILFFIERAYKLTDPNWQKERRNYKRWKVLAKKGLLSPYTKKINVSRSSIVATSEEEIWEFYSKKLGFRIHNMHIPEDNTECYFLYGLGKSYIEIHCLNRKEELPEQVVILNYENLDKIRRRIEKAGLEVGEYGTDIFTKHRTLSIIGPDNVKITFIEN